MSEEQAINMAIVFQRGSNIRFIRKEYALALACAIAVQAMPVPLRDRQQ